MTRRAVGLFGLVAAAVLVMSGCGPELGPIAKLRSITSPGLPETSDPSVVLYKNEYYVYGSDNHVRAPVTRTKDLTRRYTLPQKNAITSDAMPTKAPWAVQQNQHWAPTVGLFNGRWVMFFSADRASGFVGGNRQCIGRATASSPLGPFAPGATPVTCGLDRTGGALDPQIFRDQQGRLWLHVAFGNTETPLHAIPLDANGNFTGNATPILGRQHPWEYHFIENPSMIYDPTRGDYLLAYSAGRWWESAYRTGIARCATATGPCTSDPSGPWIASSNGRTGPGGLTFFHSPSGNPWAMFSTFQAGRESTSGGRATTVMPLTLQPAVGLGPVTK